MDDDPITLREYVDMRLMELEKRLDQRTALLVEQNAERTRALNERLAGMNEFRDQLREQASKFAGADKVDASLTALRAYVDLRLEAADRLTRALSEASDKQGDEHWMTNLHRIEALEQFQANLLGRMAIIGGGSVLLSIAVAIALHFIR